jgi:hypothetical protein
MLLSEICLNEGPKKGPAHELADLVASGIFAAAKAVTVGGAAVAALHSAGAFDPKTVKINGDIYVDAEYRSPPPTAKVTTLDNKRVAYWSAGTKYSTPRHLWNNYYAYVDADGQPLKKDHK